MIRLSLRFNLSLVLEITAHPGLKVLAWSLINSFVLSEFRKKLCFLMLLSWDSGPSSPLHVNFESSSQFRAPSRRSRERPERRFMDVM